MRNNKLIKQLSDKWRNIATRIAETYCKNNNVIAEEEFYRKYYQEYKKIVAEEHGDYVKEFNDFTDKPVWKIYQELIRNMPEPQFDNATFTEKQAFLGYRNQIIEEILRIPGDFVMYYEGTQQE